MYTSTIRCLLSFSSPVVSKIHVFIEKEIVLIIVVYLDDLLVTGSSNEQITVIVNKIKSAGKGVLMNQIGTKNEGG